MTWLRAGPYTGHCRLALPRGIVSTGQTTQDGCLDDLDTLHWRSRFHVHRFTGYRVSTKLYKSSRVYDFFMKRIGYERSINRFLATLNIDTHPAGRILDAGCGTGLLGLHFLQRWPQAQLHATDLEPNFLHTTLANAALRGLPADRILTSVSNISSPKQATALDGTSRTLADNSYNLICLGAVVGYAEDTVLSLRQLMQLLAPGGILINLEMSESLTGRFVSWRYQYQNIPLARIEQVIREEGGEMTPTSLGLKYFPACLTRNALVARKADC